MMKVLSTPQHSPPLTHALPGVPPPGAARRRSTPAGVGAKARRGPSYSPPSAGETPCVCRPCNRSPSRPGPSDRRRNGLLNTMRSGSAGSNWVIALSIAKRRTGAEGAAHVQSGGPLLVHRPAGRSRAAGACGGAAARPGSWPRAAPKSAITRVCASRRLRRKSQVSSEWKRTVPRRGEPEPWCSTTIQDETLAVVVDHEDLEAGVRLVAVGERADRTEGGHARAPEHPERMRVEPCSWPKAQW